MIVKMLEAVSEMLNFNDSDLVVPTGIQIKCAKTILDKVIEGMKEKDVAVDYTNDPRRCGLCRGYDSHTTDCPNGDFKLIGDIPGVPPRPTPKVLVPPKPKPDEVEVVADGGIIKQIKNAQEDTHFIVDGIKHHWSKCIGMSFTEITRAD